ncbi:cytochrome c [Candidatus Parabeggiatoa sp. HSG14]|uniref:cytochrome c n=1 Tax=Candidatus Parabeggiatoa sp. HSG14 TaxID=3055593 RepID=UPI0025A6F261|nr:cytochrome c [Thiotrichales bacterium HSG14]
MQIFNNFIRVGIVCLLSLIPLVSYAGSSVPTYDPETRELILPRVYVGDEEYHAVLRLETTPDGVMRFVFSKLDFMSTLTFKNRGKLVGSFTLAELKDKLAPTDVSVIEPHYNSEITYRGFPARELFDLIYGKEWRDSEEVLFTALDGYQPSIPVQKFLDHTSYVTYKAPGYSDFQVIKVFTSSTGPGTFEVANLGPFYLVWENVEDKDAPSGEDFPYQMASIDLITFAERFPEMAAPQDSGENVKRGFLQFRQHCMVCHMINGKGGTRGPDLTYVTKKLSDKTLKEWIIYSKDEVMPPLEPELVAGEDVNVITDEIVAYLKAKAQE